MPAAPWEMLLAIAAEGARDVSTAAIARRLGLSTERVARVLDGVPSSVLKDTKVGRTVVWNLVNSPDDRVPAAAIAAALRRLASRPSGRRRRGDAVAGHLEDIHRARRVLAESGPIACARMVREESITAHSVLASVPEAGRRVLQGQLALFSAEMAMNQGRPGPALRAAARGLEHAAREPELLVRLHAVSGAACRMLRAEKLPESLRHFERALEMTAGVGLPTRRSMRRWILASSSTPWVLMNNLAHAERLARCSLDEIEGDDPTSAAESGLLLVRALLWQGVCAPLSSLFDFVRRDALAGAPWIRGWCHRYEADIAWKCHVDGEYWARSIEAAWWNTNGYGFQRLQLMARVAWSKIPESWIERLSPRCIRSMTLAAGRLHTQRLGVTAENCAVCRAGSWRRRVSHALALGGQEFPAFWR